MAFSNATNFQIDRSTFNDAQGDINYYIQRNYNHHVGGDYNQHISVHGEQDIRSCIHSAMKDHIHTDALHDSGARRDPSRCYPGTREAALETISGWVGDPASHCLWLHGPAGTGKSAIAQTFAERCHQAGMLGATYFFTKGSSQGLPPLFSTLAYQFVSTFPGLDEQLWAVIRADQTIFERSLSAQLDRLIVQPFLKLDNTSASVVVIIDGLDECDGESIQGEIVRLILGLEEHSLPLLFLISSRPEHEIRRAFESFPQSSLARLPLDRTLDSDHDIHHFLRKEFDRIYVEMGMPPVSQLPWPSTEDIKMLVDKSSGHFIYAATVIRFVQEDHAHPMDQLDAILRIPNGSASAPAVKGVVADSIAFRELDGLYLHILRKDRNRMELPMILRAIMDFVGNGQAGYIETIFDLRPGSVHVMLRGLHSIINVTTDDKPLLFFHASFRDFLADPERSYEFYLDTSHFNAELACAYTRLIVEFSFAKSGPLWGTAMSEVAFCLKSTAGLLSDTLGIVVNIATQESTPPCLLYVLLDFLLQDALKELPGAEAERKHCKTILQQVEPQLIGLSDRIFTIVRVLGAQHIGEWDSLALLPVGEASQLIGVPSGGEMVEKNLNNHGDHIDDDMGRTSLLGQAYKSLYPWLLTHHQPKKWRPTCVAVHQYTWAWAWNTFASQCRPKVGVDFVHFVDLIYGCLRFTLLDFGQPINLVPPLTQQRLKRVPQVLRHVSDVRHWPQFDFLGLVEAMDFTSMLRALPDLTITFCPRLFCLHRALDELSDCLQPDVGFADPPPYNLIPHYQGFLEIIYSRLLQDPLVLRVIPIIYAMFGTFLPQTVVQLLASLVSGAEVEHSAAMQGLFGFGFWVEGDGSLPVSSSLGVLLKMGRVKLRPSQDNGSGHIDDYMGDAHEYLAFSCVKHLASYTGPEGNEKRGSVGWYAKRCWSNHLKRANPSERLIDMLRWVDMNTRDIKTVIRWLEERPNMPEDILTRWHAAQVDPNTIHGSPLDPGKEEDCLLDWMFQARLNRHIWAPRQNAPAALEMDEDSEWVEIRNEDCEP